MRVRTLEVVLTDRSALFTHSAPVLPVDNAVKTAAYYEEKLGFKTTFVYGDPPHYIIVNRDDAVSIHFSEREDTSTKIQPCAIYVFVTDVDALYEEYREKGLEIFTPPENQDYGMREFEIADPNGHFLTFGQSL